MLYCAPSLKSMRVFGGFVPNATLRHHTHSFESMRVFGGFVPNAALRHHTHSFESMRVVNLEAKCEIAREAEKHACIRWLTAIVPRHVHGLIMMI